MHLLLALLLAQLVEHQLAHQLEQHPVEPRALQEQRAREEDEQ